MKIVGVFVAALVAAACASAQTSNDAPLPSAKEYFELAADAQTCNGGQPTELPELKELRTQTLDYYHTKLSKAGSGSDQASTDAVSALEANVVPAEQLERAASMKRIAADWAAWCRGIPSNIRYAHARHDLAMASIDWPGAMPLEQAHKAVAALEVHATKVQIAPLSSPLSPKFDSATPAIVCKSGGIDVLQGTQAGDGARYTTATGLTVATPVVPDKWTVVRCYSGGVALVHRDAATQGVLLAMATDVGIAPWTGDKDFEEQVRRIVAQSTVAGVHRKVDDVKAVTSDGRPCIDVRRSGTSDFLLAEDGRRLAGPFEAREFLRACHLRDRRGPEAAVLIFISATGLRDMASFDDAAKALVDGVKLPLWMR